MRGRGVFRSLFKIFRPKTQKNFIPSFVKAPMAIPKLLNHRLSGEDRPLCLKFQGDKRSGTGACLWIGKIKGCAREG